MRGTERGTEKVTEKVTDEDSMRGTLNVITERSTGRSSLPDLFTTTSPIPLTVHVSVESDSCTKPHVTDRDVFKTGLVDSDSVLTSLGILHDRCPVTWCFTFTFTFKVSLSKFHISSTFTFT